MKNINLFALALLLLSACESPGTLAGRRGNNAYTDSSYDEAATAYRRGTRALKSDEPGPNRSKLYNNLGAARYQQHGYKAARSAFIQAIASARDEEALVRALYNAGNTAHRMDSAQVALARYRAALLSDPENEDAKFNFEFVKRHLPESQKKKQPQNQDQPDVEPSDYARKLKEKADEMVSHHKYRAAHQLMEHGLQVDRTVRAYQSFMKRLKDISDIEDSDIENPPSHNQPPSAPHDPVSPSHQT